MNDGRCRCCGKSLADCRPNAIYCSPRCSRRWRTVGGAPLRDNETTILVERRKLDTAPRACRTCTCPNPMSLVDEDGE